MCKSFKHRYVTVVLLITVMFAEVAFGATPVLTGRWGDKRLPQQLAYEYSSKKSHALVVVTFSTICPLAQRLVPTLNVLQEKYADQGIHFVALFPNGMDDLHAIAEYAVDTKMAFPVLTALMFLTMTFSSVPPSMTSSAIAERKVSKTLMFSCGVGSTVPGTRG